MPSAASDERASSAKRALVRIWVDGGRAVRSIRLNGWYPASHAGPVNIDARFIARAAEAAGYEGTKPTVVGCGRGICPRRLPLTG